MFKEHDAGRICFLCPYRVFHVSPNIS